MGGPEAINLSQVYRRQGASVYCAFDASHSCGVNVFWVGGKGERGKERLLSRRRCCHSMARAVGPAVINLRKSVNVGHDILQGVVDQSGEVGMGG